MIKGHGRQERRPLLQYARQSSSLKSSRQRFLRKRNRPHTKLSPGNQSVPPRFSILLSVRAECCAVDMPLGSFALFHLVTIFPLAWIALVRGEQTGEMLAMQVVGAAFRTVAIVASGYVADRIGRRGHLMLCAILTALFSLSAPFLIDVGRTGQYSFLLSAFALMGFFFGQASGSIADNFSTRLRYTGSALTSDLAWLIGAGFAPAAAFYLATRFGIAFIGIYLLSGAICSAVALVIAGRSRTGESKSERI